MADTVWNNNSYDNRQDEIKTNIHLRETQTKNNVLIHTVKSYIVLQFRLRIHMRCIFAKQCSPCWECIGTCTSTQMNNV